MIKWIHPSNKKDKHIHMGNCQNYGPFLGPYYNTGPNTGPNLGDPKRDHNFDNPPHTTLGKAKEFVRALFGDPKP